MSKPSIVTGTELRAMGDFDSDVRVILPAGRLAFLAIESRTGPTHILTVQDVQGGLVISAWDRNNKVIKSMTLADMDLGL